MSSSMLNVSHHLALAPKGLGSSKSNLHGTNFNFPKSSSVHRACTIRSKTLIGSRAPKCSVSIPRPASQPRFIQHKKEAFWFYRFLSIMYDHVINPGHWTEDMRDEALEPADLNRRDAVVVDVGGGTGFTTLGIVKRVDAKNVTILDQSPYQLAKAKEKEGLKECRIIEGDAEDLPFQTDYADRYVSAGRIFDQMESICKKTVVSEEKCNNFIPVLRSGEWSDIGHRQYMKDTHICIPDLARNFNNKFLGEEAISFYGSKYDSSAMCLIYWTSTNYLIKDEMQSAKRVVINKGNMLPLL